MWSILASVDISFRPHARGRLEYNGGGHWMKSLSPTCAWEVGPFISPLIDLQPFAHMRVGGWALLDALDAANLPTEKTRIERQIKTTDAEIDNLVNERYSLTEDEIKIVEGAA